jgi:hypothetical protein
VLFHGWASLDAIASRTTLLVLPEVIRFFHSRSLSVHHVVRQRHEVILGDGQLLEDRLRQGNIGADEARAAVRQGGAYGRPPPALRPVAPDAARTNRYATTGPLDRLLSEGGRRSLQVPAAATVAPSRFQGYSHRMMSRTTSRSISRLHWLRRLGRSLALVAQLLVVLVPLSEGHEQRARGAHVEAPRTTPHNGHRPDTCPACTLASILGQVDEPPRLDDATVRIVAAIEPSFARSFARSDRTGSNDSRAPPHSA